MNNVAPECKKMFCNRKGFDIVGNAVKNTKYNSEYNSIISINDNSNAVFVHFKNSNCKNVRL